MAIARIIRRQTFPVSRLRFLAGSPQTLRTARRDDVFPDVNGPANEQTETR